MSLSPAGRWVSRRAYGRPDCAIHLSDFNPPDGPALCARSTVTVPYGIEDMSAGHARNGTSGREILFVGLLTPSKGVMTLLEASRRLKERGVPFHCRFMGEFASPQFRSEFERFVADHGLGGQVEVLGVLTGAAKWKAFASADIFCFPTYFESESFGVVLLEAMQFNLPIVTTRWRGTLSLVTDGDNGFLVPIQSPDEVSARLERLLRDPALRVAMGARGRERFLREYTLDRWHPRMEEVLVRASGADA
jgi:glycosyltransferase involved in cell wall biosynthesis